MVSKVIVLMLLIIVASTLIGISRAETRLAANANKKLVASSGEADARARNARCPSANQSDILGGVFIKERADRSNMHRTASSFQRSRGRRRV